MAVSSRKDFVQMPKKVIPITELPVLQKGSPVPSDKGRYQEGLIILTDKPGNWSSFDLVKYVRNRVPVKKVGHAGTLDPLATGLLILCCGKATKSISQIQDLDKTYIAEIRFGASTPSYDSATEPDEIAGWEHISKNDIVKTLEDHFQGVISQKPPIYSAIRMDGQRLYKIARRGGEVKIEPRDVHIIETELLNVSLPDVTLKVRCGKGTYIRSIAHDLGILLDSRAHIRSLRRTHTGYFSVDQGFTPDEFNNVMNVLQDG